MAGECLDPTPKGGCALWSGSKNAFESLGHYYRTNMAGFRGALRDACNDLVVDDTLETFELGWGCDDG